MAQVYRNVKEYLNHLSSLGDERRRTICNSMVCNTTGKPSWACELYRVSMRENLASYTPQGQCTTALKTA
eukprot:4479017-Alexandrium_andersonii.AAC.1